MKSIVWLSYDRSRRESSVTTSFRARKKKWRHFQGRRKRKFVCVCLRNTFRFCFAGICCLTKASCFLTLACSPPQRPDAERLETHSHPNPGWAWETQPPGVWEVTSLPSNPPLAYTRRPGAPSAKRKGRVVIHSDVKGPLLTTLLPETLTFQ